jgi:hypothetical protein
MSVSCKGVMTEIEGSNSLYQSHHQITIERCFEALVQRSVVLRGPLEIPIARVGPLVSYLCCLHYYYINRNVVIQGSNNNVAGMM